MTDIFLEAFFLAPTIFYLVEDRIDFTKWDLPRLVQYDWITVALPAVWAYTIFLYRWIYLFEDATLLMLAQLLIGGITSWNRYAKRFETISLRVFDEEGIKP